MNDERENSLQAEIARKYQSNNRIYSVLFEVTHRCMCHCIHCFLLKNNHADLTLEEITSLFLQLKKEGVLELAISGGEPFLRKDLPEILKLMKKQAFISNVLTTGILIKKPEVTLLSENNVKKIEISILGAGPATHDSIMQYPGAFNKMIKAVKLLKDAHILVALKATIMKPNWKELKAMAKLAESLGVYFSASLSLVPREDKDTGIQKLSLSRDEIKKLDMALINGGMIPGEEHPAKARLTCRAGNTTAGISSSGDVYPCILLREKVGSIRESTIEQIWHTSPHSLLVQLRSITDNDMKECYSCNLANSCSRCPGVAYMESGSLFFPSPSACHYAESIK